MTDLIRRDDAIRALSGACSNWEDDAKVQEIVMAIPSAKPTGDIISRADAIEAVRKELVCDGRHETHDKTCRFIADVLLSALPSAEIPTTDEKHQLSSETPTNAPTDLIRREDAIEAVIAQRHRAELSDYNFALRLAEDAIRHLPSAEAVQEWIPCSERLPDVGENVLFTTDIYGGYVAEGDRRADGKWWQYRWNSLLQNDEVTAWMPLPTPYKGGDDE